RLGVGRLGGFLAYPLQLALLRADGGDRQNPQDQKAAAQPAHVRDSGGIKITAEAHTKGGSWPQGQRADPARLPSPRSQTPFGNEEERLPRMRAFPRRLG